MTSHTYWSRKLIPNSAASAIAGNTFLRSLCGAGFPLFASYMFNGLGINWASTVLGCVAVILIPIPVVFYMYGDRIRAKSSFAPTGPSPTKRDDDADNASPAPLNVEKSEQADHAALANAPRVDRETAA